LKDSLGQKSFTTFIVTFSPSSICYTETLSTLAFATNAKAVKQQVEENKSFKAELNFKSNESHLNRLRKSPASGIHTTTGVEEQALMQQLLRVV